MKISQTESRQAVDLLWETLQDLESCTNPEKDLLRKHLVGDAYAFLNRLGYTKHRPRWEASSPNTFDEPIPATTKPTKAD